MGAYTLHFIYDWNELHGEEKLKNVDKLIHSSMQCILNPAFVHRDVSKAKANF